jgi:ribosomal protein S28E/S33
MGKNHYREIRKFIKGYVRIVDVIRILREEDELFAIVE